MPTERASTTIAEAKYSQWPSVRVEQERLDRRAAVARRGRAACRCSGRSGAGSARARARARRRSRAGHDRRAPARRPRARATGAAGSVRRGRRGRSARSLRSCGVVRLLDGARHDVGDALARGRERVEAAVRVALDAADRAAQPQALPGGEEHARGDGLAHDALDEPLAPGLRPDGDAHLARSEQELAGLGRHGPAPAVEAGRRRGRASRRPRARRAWPSQRLARGARSRDRGGCGRGRRARRGPRSPRDRGRRRCPPRGTRPSARAGGTGRSRWRSPPCASEATQVIREELAREHARLAASASPASIASARSVCTISVQTAVTAKSTRSGGKSRLSVRFAASTTWKSASATSRNSEFRARASRSWSAWVSMAKCASATRASAPRTQSASDAAAIRPRPPFRTSGLRWKASGCSRRSAPRGRSQERAHDGGGRHLAREREGRGGGHAHDERRGGARRVERNAELAAAHAASPARAAGSGSTRAR